MATASQAVQGPAISGSVLIPVRWRTGWIADPWTDLCWFIGGALAGYGLFFLHAGLQWDMLKVWVVWYVFVDAPHFFGTHARTYLDREEFRRRRLLLLGSLGWLVVGPVLILLSWVLYRLEWSHYPAPFQVLVGFVGLWAYWHVVRQHYGIMALYKRKNQDRDLVDCWIDQVVLYVGLLAPFVAFIARHPDTRGSLGLTSVGPMLPFGSWDLTEAIVAGTAAAVGLAVLMFLLRQLQLRQLGQPINGPKCLFLLAVVPLHVLICYHPATLTTYLLGFSAFVTIFHDLQYHAIVWHYQRNRCHRPGTDPRRFGLAAILSRNVLIYAGCAISAGILAWAFGCYLGIQPIGCIPLVASGEILLFGTITLQHLLASFALGFLMHHYFVDQFIWRPGKDAQLRHDLNVAPSLG